MKRENVKQHDVFDAAQTRLRLIISTLQDQEQVDEEELESLDFTTPAPQADSGTGETDPTSAEKASDDQ
jgi:hypothetical protein